MKMTDEKFIELLRKIKEHCEKQCKCCDCKFYANGECQIMFLAIELSEPPSAWDMEEIERIIRL